MGTGHFWTFRCPFPWQAQGTLHLPKSEQNVKAFLVAVGRRGTYEGYLQRCILRARRSTRDT